MERYIRKLGKGSLIVSIFLTILSIFMITNTTAVINLFVILFGYVLVLDGLIHLTSYFAIKDEYRYFSYELAQAIISIILGFIVVCNYTTIPQILPIVFGIWIVLQGILQLQIALNIRSLRSTNWAIMTVTSLVSIAIGAAMIFSPFESLEALMKMTGAVLLFTQLLNIYDDIYILLAVKDVERKVQTIEVREEVTVKKAPVRKATTTARKTTTTKRTATKKTTTRRTTKK